MKILLFGNTGYVTKKFIQEAFPKDTVYLLGETDLKSSKKIHKKYCNRLHYVLY